MRARRSMTPRSVICAKWPRRRVPLIGICTGSFILCRAGLMNGRRSCVSWYHYQDFLEAFPGHDVVADRLFLADGPRITCAGGAGAAALATYLIEQHLGRGRRTEGQPGAVV